MSNTSFLKCHIGSAVWVTVLRLNINDIESYMIALIGNRSSSSCRSCYQSVFENVIISEN